MLPECEAILREYFDFEGVPMDVDPINEWVSGKTQGKIPALLADGATDAAVFVLLSAIYFKASWASKFEVRHMCSCTCYCMSWW